MPLHRLLLMAGAGWLLAASAAQAISFGRPPASVALGSTLDLVLPVRLEADELLEPECVSAELTIGERRVPPHNLRWAVEPGAGPSERQIRVISLVVVDEPVVTVQINTGCTLRMSRRFTAFADPPLAGAVGPAAPAVGSFDSGGAPAQPAPRRLAAPTVAAGEPAASAPRPAARPLRRSAAASRTPRERQPATEARPSAPAAPRLSLEAPDPALLRQAMAAAIAEQQASAAQAAEAASAATAAAALAAARVQVLEQQVQRLLDEGKRQREELQQLRSQAARQSSAERWLPWMGALLAMALALAAWLGLRLRHLQREAHTRWWADAAEVLADAQPDPQPAAKVAAPRPRGAVATDAGSTLVPAASPGAAPARRAAAELDLTLPAAADEADTALGPVTVEPEWSRTAPPPRAVSADELIDLEQQAEFFVVLGQDEAAIDLLVSHLRDSGGTSPLPYLKLLEIHRRRGEREAYDRTRERFNQRFNAYAPDWDTDMQQGRVLADYIQVLMRLQRAWPSPIDAMAELQTLLFRTDEGELFDLPAYREVLMLYSVARDLYDHEAREAPDVDVLLPLQPTGFGSTEAMPEAAMVGEATMVLTPELRLEGPTQYHAVDLDLGPAPPAPKPSRR